MPNCIDEIVCLDHRTHILGTALCNGNGILNMVNFTALRGIIVQFLAFILLTLVIQLACSSSNNQKEFLHEYEKVQARLIAQAFGEALRRTPVMKETTRKPFG